VISHYSKLSRNLKFLEILAKAWEVIKSIFMVALCNRADHYIFMLYLLLLSSFFISSPNLSGRRLDVYHTSAHGVALVRI